MTKPCRPPAHRRTLAPFAIVAVAVALVGGGGCGDERPAAGEAPAPAANVDLTGRVEPMTVPGAASGAAAAPPAGSATPSGSAPATLPAPGLRGLGAPDFTALVARVGPSVVNVTTTQLVRPTPAAGPRADDPLSEFFRRFGVPQQGEGGGGLRRGVGSGFVVDTAGHVLTNAHVVADADEVLVRLADSKREYKAKVVGSDRQTDVALLKVDAPGLPAAPLGDSSRLAAGEWVAAIGSPFGFANTITAGIVSATERALPDETYVPFIQTDVAVNPGNSGGPLLDLRGEVVGINSQIYSRTGGYMGVSFAIPINVVMDIAQQLRTEGRVRRGRLGIGIQEMSSELAESFGLKEPRGAIVTSVEPDSPAAKAGLAAGDVVLGIDGKAIEGATDLPRLVASHKPGTSVTLDVARGGERRSVAATLAEAPAPPSQSPRAKAPDERGGHKGMSRLGIAVSELPPAGRRALGVDYGLVVEGVEGDNADSPLRRGDVIVGVGAERFRSLDEFNRRVREARAGSRVALLVRRGEATLYVPVTVGTG